MLQGAVQTQGGRRAGVARVDRHLQPDIELPLQGHSTAAILKAPGPKFALLVVYASLYC